MGAFILRYVALAGALILNGCGYWIRTSEFWSQSPMPYRLAKPQYLPPIVAATRPTFGWELPSIRNLFVCRQPWPLRIYSAACRSCTGISCAPHKKVIGQRTSTFALNRTFQEFLSVILRVFNDSATDNLSPKFPTKCAAWNVAFRIFRR